MTGSDRIQQEMKLLKDELSSLRKVTAERTSNLEESVVGLEEYQTEFGEFIQWVEEIEVKVKVNAHQFDLHAPEQLEMDLEVCTVVFADVCMLAF